MSRLLLVLGFAAVLVSGCSSPDAARSPDGQATAPAVADFTFSVTDCREVTMVVFLDFDQAARSLPDGFVPEDAAALLGSPAPTGRGAALLTNAICGTATNDPAGYVEGAVAVLVQAPAVAGEDVADYNFYEFGLATRAGPVRDGLAAAGWTFIGSDVSSEIGEIGVYTATSQVGDESGPLYSVEATAPPAGPTLTGTFRWWQQAATGLGYLDYVFTAPGHFGPATCTVRPGSLAADITGLTSCQPGDAVAGILPAFTGEVRFRFLEGVTPG